MQEKISAGLSPNSLKRAEMRIMQYFVLNWAMGTSGSLLVWQQSLLSVQKSLENMPQMQQKLELAEIISILAKLIFRSGIFKHCNSFEE